MANKHTTLSSLFKAIADAIRGKTGSTATLVADDFPNAISMIETGSDVSGVTATASDVLSGKIFVNSSGEEVTGNIATKTSSNLTASGATVTVPAGYYASNATKSVSTATQATPSISVSSSGLITASSTQSAGYVSSGTKSSTKQLTTASAKTITPNTSTQTAVSSGVYTTGAITVAAVPTETKSVQPSSSQQTITPSSGKFLSSVTVYGEIDLLPENIRSGVSIFGVSGSYDGKEVVVDVGRNIVTVSSQNVYIYPDRSIDTVHSFCIYLTGMFLGDLVHIYIMGQPTTAEYFYYNVDTTESDTDFISYTTKSNSVSMRLPFILSNAGADSASICYTPAE
jgi:hypothetical protein